MAASVSKYKEHAEDYKTKGEVRCTIWHSVWTVQINLAPATGLVLAVAVFCGAKNVG